MMFTSSDTLNADAPKLAAVTLRVSRDQASRKMQTLFLDGRQINALYICTDEELRAAEQRKMEWIAAAHELCAELFKGSEPIDFFDDITINVLKKNDPIEALTEQFHNELNQRLERIRMIRNAIEKAADQTPPKIEGSAIKRPSSPIPQPQRAPAAPQPVSDPGTELGVSSAAEGLRLSDDTPAKAPAKTAAAAPASTSTTASKNKIMLILCSRNGTARQALCRFANQMNLSFEIIDYNPEQPSAIIEQIYRHRDSKFCVVYWGEPGGRELPGSAHPERYVGFSLGFALGRLGRGRVFILGSTTTPPLPGFTRILVSQLDSGGGWQIQMARRMKAAGVDIDLNKMT